MSKQTTPRRASRRAEPPCSAEFIADGKMVCRCQRPLGHLGENHVSESVFPLEDGSLHKVRWPQNSLISLNEKGG